MKLYKLSASDSQKFWGTPENPTRRNAAIVGQAPDCSSFLIMTTEIEAYLEENPIFDDFAFTYCQQWGLRITPEVIARVWNDLRSKAYPSVGEQLGALYKGGEEFAAMAETINTVKLEIPKMVNL